MKKASIIALVIGLVLFFAGLICTDLFADEFPSAYYLKQAVRQVTFTMQVSGGVTAFTGLIGLIFNKKMVQHCNLKTTGLALGISAMGSLGIHCALSFLSCYFLTNPYRHPIRHSASVCIGMIGLGAFLALVYLYYRIRQENASVSGVVLDVVLGLIHCVPFYFVYVTLDNLISGMI